jgi:hypothetical protein
VVPRWCFLMLRCFRRHALQGRHKSAQGNALGTRGTNSSKPPCKGGTIVGTVAAAVWGFRMFHPYRARKIGEFRCDANVPRALPWAALFGPVGAREQKRHTKTGASGWFNAIGRSIALRGEGDSRCAGSP